MTNTDISKPKRLIKYKSLPQGSGKSRSAFKYASNCEKPIIITTPTDALSLQYEEHFIEHQHSVSLISRKRHQDASSHQKFKDSCKSETSRILVNRDVLHATDAGLFKIFDIIEDEFPEPLKLHKFNNAQHIRSILTSFLDIEMTVSSRYYRLTLTPTALDLSFNGWNYAGVKDMADVVELCNKIISVHHDVYVLADSYARFAARELNDIQFWSVMKPSVYGETVPTLIGAHAEDRLFEKLWREDVTFEEATHIVGDYEDLKEQAKRGRIIYVSNKKLTGAQMDAVGRRKLHDHVSDAIAEKFPETPYIFGINKNSYGKEYPWLREGVDATRVGLVAHGQNAFKHIDMAVYIAAQYLDSPTYRFLQEVYGISGNEVTRDSYEKMLQFLMRSSARVKDSEAPFIWIVPDLEAAQYLQQKMPVKELEFLDIGIPELHEFDEMNQTPEDKKRKDAESAAKRRNKAKMAKEAHENTVQYQDFKLILWASKYAQELVTANLSWFDLGAYLKDSHQSYSPKNKSQARCFREGDLADLQNHKLVSNLQSTRLIIMDMDVVKRDPQDLSDYLHSNRISHFIFNSYSSTPLEPRIRVVIGLDEAVNPANYLHIMRLLQADIDAYFGQGIYVIDGSKFTVNSKFHNPSVPQFKSDIFIERHCGLDGYKFEPKFLDVRWFLSRNAPISAAKEKVETNTSVARLAPIKETVDDILDRWSVAPGQGQGSYNFHQAAVDLKKASVSRDDAIQLLTANRFRFGDGADRDAVYTVGRVYDAVHTVRAVPSKAGPQLAI